MCINTLLSSTLLHLAHGATTDCWLLLPVGLSPFPWSLVTGGLSRPLRKGAGLTFGFLFPVQQRPGVCSSAVLKIALQAGTKLKSSFLSLLVGFLASEQRELSAPQPCACPPRARLLAGVGMGWGTVLGLEVSGGLWAEAAFNL